MIKKIFWGFLFLVVVFIFSCWLIGGYFPTSQSCAKKSLTSTFSSHLDVNKVYSMCMKANGYGF